MKSTDLKVEKLPALSAFFPAHNEEDNLPILINNAVQVFSRVANEFEIVIVDDGSSDNTKGILENLKKNNPNLVTVYHEHNMGYGAALRSGLTACRYEYIFFSDSDNQFDLNEISHLISHIRDHDVVIGYRGKRRDPFMRTINAFGWKLIIRLFLGVRARDINCAFKLFHRSHIKDIELISDGAMISAELLAYLDKKKLRVKEVKVTHFPRKSGDQTGANLKVIARAFKELFIIKKSLKKFLTKNDKCN